MQTTTNMEPKNISQEDKIEFITQFQKGLKKKDMYRMIEDVLFVWRLRDDFRKENVSEFLDMVYWRSIYFGTKVSPEWYKKKYKDKNNPVKDECFLGSKPPFNSKKWSIYYNPQETKSDLKPSYEKVLKEIKKIGLQQRTMNEAMERSLSLLKKETSTDSY